MQTRLGEIQLEVLVLQRQIGRREPSGCVERRRYDH